MISALLDVSRIQSGRFSIVPTPLQLNGLVRRVVEEWQIASSTHQIGLVEPDEMLFVHGDEVRLEQVLHSLLNNAVKYSPNGGPITISLERQNSEACIAVRDEGVGIPEAARGQLFRRFYRADNAERLGVSGLGIGLFVASEIVELHGGEIDVTSTEGRGSTFTLRLPLAPEAQRSPRARPDSDTPPSTASS
jgi:signal transduction histidine kinase